MVFGLGWHMFTRKMVRSNCLWSALGAALVASACSPSPSNAVGPGLRKASAQAPCSKSKNGQKLTGSELNLSEGSRAIAKQAEPSTGGYISIRFYGISTQEKLFKNPIQTAIDKDVEFGNPLGVVDVLNIPYCTTAAPRITEARLKSCVSRKAWEVFASNTELKERVTRSEWSPKLQYKRCTAMVTLDEDDAQPRNGIQRVRFWTAEHCYQPSYATEVIFHLSSSENAVNAASNSRYVTLPVPQVDGIEYVKKVVSKDGSGNQSDALLRQKLFILRSLDGRSAETYNLALNQGCLKNGSAVFPSQSARKIRYVDCFTTADIATFKASIAINRLGEVETEKLLPSERKLNADTLRDLRREALNRLVELDRKRPAVVESLLRQLGINAKIDFSRSVPFVRRVFSMSQMVTAQLDGIQTSRRIEAMNYEQKEQEKSGQEIFLSHTQLGGVQNQFKQVDFKFDDSDMDSEQIPQKLISQFLCHQRIFDAGIAGNLLSGFLCPFKMAPPDTAQLEEFTLGVSPNLENYVAQRAQVFFLVKLGNRALPDNHPFKILPTDSDSLANIKMGAAWTRTIFEAATLRVNPWSEVPEGSFWRETTNTFKLIFKVACPVSGVLLNSWFPAYSNLKIGKSTTFSGVPFSSSNEAVFIFPFGKNGLGSANFESPKCRTLKKLLQPPVLLSKTDNTINAEVAIPVSPALGVDSDDTFINSGSDSAAYEYMARRLIYRFEGIEEKREVVPTDSGTTWSLLGLPALTLSSHNGELTNGAVFPDMPDINTADPDAAAPVDAQGRPIVGCDGR